MESRTTPTFHGRHVAVVVCLAVAFAKKVQHLSRFAAVAQCSVGIVGTSLMARSET